ncbi:EAL domain-containing protein [Alkalimonas collagenimarina]|uniref:EAL domain-containing protein n=1 Tax=Alkalimonas collagenimarina TaxID=400390 RepID=A0ABT9GUF6_9GAMM|nr:EAL domain-containing protein [Alkalimonas collagenimarina]MDP4534682.1 EAL domain-containing protein [Alkalimonas collagenimarina]
MSSETTAQQKALFQLVSTITASLTASSGEEMDSTIEQALASVGQFFNADRSYLFLFNNEFTLASNTHEWCAKGVSKQQALLQQLDITVFSGWMEPFLRGEPQAIDDIHALAADSPERQLLEPQGIQSVIMLPVMAGTTLLGMVGLDIVRTVHYWQDHTIAALQLLAGNLASGLIRKEAERQVEQLVFYDPLTALPNRRFLHELLHQALKQSERDHAYGALLLIDLDHFKNLNDSFGHQQGDLYLQAIASRIQAQLAEGDTLARQGGDEFTVLLPGLGPTLNEAAMQARRMAELIVARVNEPVPLLNNLYQSSVSIGMTLFHGQGFSSDELLKQAEMAMYRAKSSGRNGVAFFDPQMQAQADQRAMLTQDLHTAIRECQFQLHYQPIVQQQSVTGVEALLRWQHPEQGMISPAVFIPFAEQTGLIIAIGDWVLMEACQQLACWQQQPELRRFTCSVNISSFQFAQADFVEKVVAAIIGSGVNPEGLRLELTESMLATDIAMVQEKMGKLQTLGVSFSLDDFGTGYCSLSYLHQLPIGQLKIDQKFVRNIHTRQGNLAITKAILALADSLDLDVVAEGVETSEELQQLKALGCRSFQGYYFSRPMPANAAFAKIMQPLNVISLAHGRGPQGAT